MQRNKLNSGIIYTNGHCIGCNKCISSCIAPGANVVVKKKDGSYIVKVDPDECILCGQCIKVCVHDARTYRDDTGEFFEALEQGEKISILVAPSLLTNYEKQYHNILGYLKSRGVNHIYNVSFGADLMTWAYVNFIQNFGLAGVISQSCPVIVDYLEKYKPVLLKYLMPVQSPMMCTAIYVSDYLKIQDKLAFLGPCIAKKHEIDDVNTYGKISYNVTFERLMEYIGEQDLSGFYAEDELQYGLGAMVPMAGGLSSNIELYIGGEEVLIKNSGPRNIFPYFDHYYSVIQKEEELPFLVDAMSCTNGCSFGTGASCGVELNNDITFAAHRCREKAYRFGNVPVATDYEGRLSLLNERFKNFALSSFVRQYSQNKAIRKKVLTKAQSEEIFQSMYKFTEEQRHVDCGACGYVGCQEMVYAIGTSHNIKENCISYAKERIRQEQEKTHELLEEISTMNEELKKSAQMKSDFLANMSHEIRTPMNSVIGMAEMALRGKLPHTEKGYIQQIKASGRSLLAIINDILDFSKIESGKMEINEVEYSVRSLIQDTIDTVLTRIGEKDVILVVDAAPDIPAVLYGDDIRIKQVLTNLTNNAIKFTKSGFIRIEFEFERIGNEGFLNAAVTDSGIGIRKEDMEKLFSSFQQLDSKRNRNIEGTGLGLAISKRFMDLMNGKIHVESVYGKGSTFSFSVPQKIVKDVPSVVIETKPRIRTASFFKNRYRKEGFLKAASRLGIANSECGSFHELEQACRDGAEYVFIEYSLWNQETKELLAAFSKTEAIVAADPGNDMIPERVNKIYLPIYCENLASVLNHEETLMNMVPETPILFEAPEARILVVDDHTVNLTVAAGLLSPFRMKVDTASGAREAIGLIQENHYDIVFMDHMMPEIDGVEATHMIRELEGEYYKKVPVIALTANAINDARQMFLKEGLDDFVAKPIDMVDITAKLKKWLPSEKIRNSSKKKREVRKEQKPEERLVIEGIDVNLGLSYTGSMEIYRSALSDYYQVIEEKAAAIRDYQESGNLESYTIEVHALKSASRLIGAVKLSEMAAFLEECGKRGEEGPIGEKTEELLQCYRAYIPILAPYLKEEVKTVKEEMEPEELRKKLTAMKSLLEDFDLDGFNTVMEEVEGCRINGKKKERFAGLKSAMNRLEYDDAIQILAEWLND